MHQRTTPLRKRDPNSDTDVRYVSQLHCLYPLARLITSAYFRSFLVTVSRNKLDGQSSLDALIEALDALDSLCATVDERYQESLASEQFEKRDEQW